MGGGIQLTRAEGVGIAVAVLLSASAGAVDIIAALLIPNLGSILIPVLAFTMGAQNASLRRVEKIPVNTAFITGNLEKLGETIASLLQKRTDRDEQLKIWVVGSIWAAYALGAAGGALAALHFGRQSLLFPAGFLCLSAILILVTHSQKS